MNKYSFIETEMERREACHQQRYLSAVNPQKGMEINIDGHTMINFCSNDYLGLSKHPKLQKKAQDYMDQYGTGSTGSRLICGSYDIFHSTEKKLADLKGTESALILNSGFQANSSLLPALTDRQTLILSDKLNHNSIIQGAILSRCKVVRFQHNDLDHLRNLLDKNRNNGFSRILIVTESVFSMDGDQTDMDTLTDLSAEYDALLVVDEAHATGVWGKQGMGLTCGKPVDVVVGTFGKACGSFGAYVACSKKLKDYLINCCYGFVYSTALPPPVIGAIDAALDLIPEMEKERRHLYSNINLLHRSLKQLDYNTGNSTTQIIPVIIGEEQKTLALSKWLQKNGILATAIRPPTVPQGQSRIRISLSSSHSREQVEYLINVFEKWEGRRA